MLDISFAALGIATEFGINRAALGFVLAAELVGMGIGSIVLGGITAIDGDNIETCVAPYGSQKFGA